MAGDDSTAGLERPPPEVAEFQRHATDLFNRAISDGEVETFLEVVDPEIDFRSITSAAEGISYQGHDGLRRYFERISDAFEEVRLEIDEIWMAAPEVLISLGRWYARGRGSGLEMDTEWSNVTELRDGKVVWSYAYQTHDEALRVGRERAAAAT